MLPEQVEEALQEVEPRRFDGCRRKWRSLFEWILRESASSCPYPGLVRTERYVELVVDNDTVTSRGSVVAVVDVQCRRIKLGLPRGLDLSGLVNTDFPNWNIRGLNGVE